MKIIEVNIGLVIGLGLLLLCGLVMFVLWLLDKRVKHMEVLKRYMPGILTLGVLIAIGVIIGYLIIDCGGGSVVPVYRF
jgi:hypothetical protein